MNGIFTIRAPAKINLGLSVLARRKDGYHEIESVMQKVSLADRLLFEPTPGRRWSFFCTDRKLSGPDNLVSRAAAMLSEQTTKKLPGVKITLYKNIPVQAGLAGGSADAAAALVGLNWYWKLGYDRAALLKLGASLGSDVPFCLAGGTALVRGRGELLEELPPLPFFWVVLALPANLQMPTAAVYKNFDTGRMGIPSLQPLVEAVREGSRDKILRWLAGGSTNTLESAVLPGSGLLRDIKKKLEGRGLRPALSGSGPALFMLTDTYIEARAASRAAEEENCRAYLCWTTTGQSSRGWLNV